MRGRKRTTQPGYHASRGWFYAPIQKVIVKWDAVFGREFTHDTFLYLRRVMENDRGHLEVDFLGAKHRKFICELMAALDALHDPENICGWVVKVWPLLNYDKQPPAPLSYTQIRQQIIDLGGSAFTTDALRKAAKRMRLTSSGPMLDFDEFSAHNTNASLPKSR